MYIFWFANANMISANTSFLIPLMPLRPIKRLRQSQVEKRCREQLIFFQGSD